MNRRILLSAVGALLFFALDSIHVHIGIWKATAHQGVPWWFVFVYFLGILGAGTLLDRVERIGRPAGPPMVWLDVASFVAILAAHILFFRYELLLAVIMLALLGARLALRQPKDLVIAVGCAGLEASVELLMAKLGLFAYSYASLGLLPLWHLPMWAALGLCIRGFFRYGHEHAPARPHCAA